MFTRLGLTLAACAAVTACGGDRTRPQVATRGGSTDWRKVATAGDRERLRTWRQAWTTALSKAQASGNAPAIAAEGALFQPDRALDGAMPPAGAYKCRVFKLGGQGAGVPDFTAYPLFQCRVDAEGDIFSFYKVGGSQRPVGLAFPDGRGRAVFLGTLMLGDEKTALDYGRDAGRDMAGIIQRVGERRWRMVLPFPRFESTLDVIELVPA